MRIYTTKDRQKNKRIGSVVFSCLFWLIIWQLLAIAVGNTLLLPSPVETLAALRKLVVMKSFYFDVGWTIFRCILAMLLSFALGVIFAWASYKKELVRSLTAIPVSFFKAVPVMAVVIYLILLMQSNWVAVAACFLMCFPIVYTNVLAGLDAVSNEFLELAQIYRLSTMQSVKLIYIPSIMSYIKSAVKLIAGLSWKAVVAAEVLSIPNYSLGYGMMNAKYYLETPTLFAYVIVIIVLSMGMEKLINLWLSKIEVHGYEGSKLGTLPINDSTNDKGAVVRLFDISKAFDGKQVLENVSGEFAGGRINVLKGPSGSGKTTIARILAGLETADSGRVEFDRNARIAYLFQEDRLLPWLNVYDNLAISMNCEEPQVYEMAKALELEDSLWKIPRELSGGMKHRVALGRTFLADGDILILDEPFRGLDEALKERIVNRLWNKSTKEKTVILITHNEQDLKLLGVD